MNCGTCRQPLTHVAATLWKGKIIIGQSTTLVGFGRGPCGHIHDDNCLQRTFFCAARHVNVLSLRRRCPKCDWVGKETCNLCRVPMVDAWPDCEPLVEDRLSED